MTDLEKRMYAGITLPMRITSAVVTNITTLTTGQRLRGGSFADHAAIIALMRGGLSASAACAQHNKNRLTPDENEGK